MSDSRSTNLMDMNANAAVSDDLSIGRSRETRSIELYPRFYPLGGFSLSKVEADFEDAVGHNVSADNVAFVNQVKCRAALS